MERGRRNREGREGSYVTEDEGRGTEHVLTLRVYPREGPSASKPVLALVPGAEDYPVLRPPHVGGQALRGPPRAPLCCSRLLQSPAMECGWDHRRQHRATGCHFQDKVTKRFRLLLAHRPCSAWLSPFSACFCLSLMILPPCLEDTQAVDGGAHLVRTSVRGLGGDSPKAHLQTCE